jgi:hypothetical protein
MPSALRSSWRTLLKYLRSIAPMHCHLSCPAPGFGYTDTGQAWSRSRYEVIIAGGNQSRGIRHHRYGNLADQTALSIAICRSDNAILIHCEPLGSATSRVEIRQIVANRVQSD